MNVVRQCSQQMVMALSLRALVSLKPEQGKQLNTVWELRVCVYLMRHSGWNTEATDAESSY